MNKHSPVESWQVYQGVLESLFSVATAQAIQANSSLLRNSTERISMLGAYSWTLLLACQDRSQAEYNRAGCAMAHQGKVYDAFGTYRTERCGWHQVGTCHASLDGM